MEDKKLLQETIKLAHKGLSWANPNPLVGALIVKNEKVIGKGCHKKAGLPHAEVNALASCKEDTRGAALYVNLEPCSHYGKTPPCVEAIIKSGITRVVCSTLDPNKKVNGKSIKKLRKAGIEVSVGICDKEARELNEAFFTFHEKKRPFVTLKFAASLDGKIATRTGDSRWITNKKARNYARALRAAHQAILVGINTVFKDNPNLGVRMKKYKDPLRIVLDSKLKIPLESQVLRDTNVLIVTTNHANPAKRKMLTERGIPLLIFDDKISLSKLMEELYKREIISVLVEGGGGTLGRFMDKKLVDRVYAFFAPIIIGGEKATSAVRGEGIASVKDALRLSELSFKRFYDNFLVTGTPNGV